MRNKNFVKASSGGETLAHELGRTEQKEKTQTQVEGILPSPTCRLACIAKLDEGHYRGNRGILKQVKNLSRTKTIVKSGQQKGKGQGGISAYCLT